MNYSCIDCLRVSLFLYCTAVHIQLQRSSTIYYIQSGITLMEGLFTSHCGVCPVPAYLLQGF